MKYVIALAALLVASLSWIPSAKADVYGGFGVGVVSMTPEDDDARWGLGLHGKVGNRWDDVGFYGVLSSTAVVVTAPGVSGTLALPSLGVGLEGFFNRISVGGYVAYAKAVASVGDAEATVGTGAQLGASLGIRATSVFGVRALLDQNWLSPPNALQSEFGDFTITQFRLVADFEWGHPDD